MKIIFYTIAVIISLYLLACLYLYFFQNRLIYKPTREMLQPSAYQLNQFEEIKIKTIDNIICTAWYKPSQKGKETIVYFHGNKGNISGRSEKLKIFADHGFGVLALSYRGYGTSQGQPYEQGLYIDARSALDYLVNKNINLDNIIIYGESLGSGVAIQMNTEYKTKALILEAPYTSVVQLGYDRYPIFPVKMMIHDHFDSVDKINHILSPVLFFHGDNDKTIPMKYSKILYNKTIMPKYYVEFPNKGHVDLDANILAKEIEKFIAR